MLKYCDSSSHYRKLIPHQDAQFAMVV